MIWITWPHRPPTVCRQVCPQVQTDICSRSDRYIFAITVCQNTRKDCRWNKEMYDDFLSSGNNAFDLCTWMRVYLHIERDYIQPRPVTRGGRARMRAALLCCIALGGCWNQGDIVTDWLPRMTRWNTSFQDKDGSRGVREASGLEEDAAWLINSSKPSQSPLFCIWFLTSTASHHSPILMSPAAISIPGAQLSICSARINTAVLSTAARDDPWRTIKLNADSH